jgi:hypothetical protein
MADWPDVILETIKIIGVPGLIGVIATYATYRGTRAQIDAKLAEIQQQNEFNARRQFFDLYKERHTTHENHTFKLAEMLGNVLGQVAGGMNDEGFLSAYHEFIRFGAGQLPMWLRLTQAEMDQYALTATEPYQNLVGHIERELVLEQSDNASSLRKNILAVMEVIVCQQACQNLIWDAQFRQVFEPYMKS